MTTMGVEEHLDGDESCRRCLGVRPEGGAGQSFTLRAWRGFEQNRPCLLGDGLAYVAVFVDRKAVGVSWRVGWKDAARCCSFSAVSVPGQGV